LICVTNWKVPSVLIFEVAFWLFYLLNYSNINYRSIFRWRSLRWQTPKRFEVEKYRKQNTTYNSCTDEYKKYEPYFDWSLPNSILICSISSMLIPMMETLNFFTISRKMHHYSVHLIVRCWIYQKPTLLLKWIQINQIDD